MSSQEAARPDGGTFLTIAFAVIGVLLLVGGGVLVMSPTSFSGYGIWIFVWGLAFLIGALSRWGEARG